jgi:hypothetical protein
VGERQSLDSADAVLTLGAAISDKRKHQRTLPGIEQGKYKLGA